MGDILDYQLPEIVEQPAMVIAGNSLSSRISRLVKLALEESPLSRSEVAGRMSERLGLTDPLRGLQPIEKPDKSGCHPN